MSERQLQTVITYARSIPADLDQRFHLLMHDGYWAFGQHVQANTGKQYWSNYQLRSARKHGGRVAVKRYLARPQRQKGVDTVIELKMPQFSIEAMVLQAPWSNLFTPEERQLAEARLRAVGFSVESLKQTRDITGSRSHCARRSVQRSAVPSHGRRHPQADRVRGPLREGPLFNAEEMEDKQDIYQWSGHLYAARTWTDDLVLTADLDLQGTHASIHRVVAAAERVFGEAAFAVRTIDFLIESHVLGRESPHPLPSAYAGRSPEDLAMFSFSQFGRPDLFGVFI